MKPGRAHKNGSLRTNQIRNRLQKHVWSILQSKGYRATDSDNHESQLQTRAVTTWPLDSGGKQTLRMQLQGTSSAEAHCESGPLGCQKSRVPYTRHARLCSMKWCSSVPRINRSRLQACRLAYLSPISSKQSPSLQNHHKSIDKQGDSQNASCTAIERYEDVDLLNGMQMGGQWDRNRRALRIGVATRRQTCNVVYILRGSCATARISVKQKLAERDDVALR